MSSTTSILEFEQVTIESSPLYETGLWNISFELNAGDLLLVRLEEEQQRVPLADAAEGLVPPAQGSVRFMGGSWQNLSAGEADTLRGDIGRVFLDEGWISDMEVDQNIMLSLRHHSRRGDQEIRDEALNLARRFGLPGLPRGRPESTRWPDLRKSACVRAFLGQPLLILLERPERGVYADLIAPLVNTVQSARRRGGAVLWTTHDPLVWNNPGLRATVRAKMFGSQMHLMPPES